MCSGVACALLDGMTKEPRIVRRRREGRHGTNSSWAAGNALAPEPQQPAPRVHLCRPADRNHCRGVHADAENGSRCRRHRPAPGDFGAAAGVGPRLADVLMVLAPHGSGDTWAGMAGFGAALPGMAQLTKCLRSRDSWSVKARDGFFHSRAFWRGPGGMTGTLHRCPVLRQDWCTRATQSKCSAALEIWRAMTAGLRLGFRTVRCEQ